MFAFRRLGMALCLVIAAGILLPGCSDDSDRAPRIKKITGVAKEIDLKNNRVSMLFKNEKGNEIVLSGAVKEDTEVWVNGKLHKLDDVREGDTVTVFGYRDKSSDEPKLIATKIEVVRPESGDWKKQDKPAESTAAGTTKSGEVAKQQ